MILEGIVTTIDAADATVEDVNVAPMGPIVDREFQEILLRPFDTSTTFKNLVATGHAVLHVTDDVELFARAVTGTLTERPSMRPAERIPGFVLEDACRWFELEVVQIDDSEQRSRIECRVVHRGQMREFWGFCRAKHAVIEAAILATRLEFIPIQSIMHDLERLQIIVDKTAGQQEFAAMSLLVDHIQQWSAKHATAERPT